MIELINILISFFPILFIPIMIVLIVYVKSVPPHTVVIIDRNTHYYKTKKRGLYFFNPRTDKVTTEISMNTLHRYYTDYFETYDGYFVRVSFYASYKANDLNKVLEALRLVRRSVDDIIEGSIYWAVRNLNYSDFITNKYVLLQEAKHILINEASELEINIVDFVIENVSSASGISDKMVFRPHNSANSNGPIQFY